MIGLGRVLLARPHQILIDTDRWWICHRTWEALQGGRKGYSKGPFEAACIVNSLRTEIQWTFIWSRRRNVEILCCCCYYSCARSGYFEIMKHQWSTNAAGVNVRSGIVPSPLKQSSLGLLMWSANHGMASQMAPIQIPSSCRWALYLKAANLQRFCSTPLANGIAKLACSFANGQAQPLINLNFKSLYFDI